jgi:colicin import membrane protein
MHERTPNALMLSLALHFGVVLAIVALAFVAQQNQPAPVQVFELVAGPPTDLTATEAPALGSQDGQVEVKIHETPVKQEPRPSEATPVVSTPEEPVLIPVAPAHPEKKTAEKAPTAKTPAKVGPIISYKDFVKKHGAPTPSRSTNSGSSRAMKAPQLKTHGIPDGVIGGSSRSHGGGGGKALTAAEHSALEAYTSRLVAALRQNHEKPPGLSDLLSADVECLIAPDGSFSSVHVVRTSGNVAFDQSCIQAFMRMGPIGPTPDGKSGTWKITFHMVDPN